MNFESTNLNWPAWILGIIVGTSIGILVALFSAPTSGDQIRERLWETSIDWRDRAEDLAAEYLAQFSPASAHSLSPRQTRAAITSTRIEPNP